MKTLSSGQIFLHCKYMGNYFSIQGHLTPIWPAFELIQDFMPVQILNMLFFLHTNASNSEVNCLSWPKSELFRDVMTVKIIYNTHEDQIKNKYAMLRPKLDIVFLSTQGHVTPKGIVRSGLNQIHPRFYAWPGYCKFNEDPIKSKGAILRTAFSPL